MNIYLDRTEGGYNIYHTQIYPQVQLLQSVQMTHWAMVHVQMYKQQNFNPLSFEKFGHSHSARLRHCERKFEMFLAY